MKSEMNTPYYKSLTRYMIPMVILVSFAPMILIGFLILHQFESSYKEKVNAHLKELVLKHKQNIDHFLKEKTGDLRVLAQSYTIERLRDPVFLSEKLAILQTEYKGVFVDLGVVGDDGHQAAYAGPFKLGHADYSHAGWFEKAMQNEVFVSDVFLGLRGLPHFIISIKKQVGDSTWILRSTIDFVAFNDLVENIRIGETGFAFIVNTKNELQTTPRIDITSEKGFYQRLLETPHKGESGVHITQARVDEVNEVFYSDEYIYVSSFLKNGDWLLVYRQNGSDAFSIITKARHLTLLIFILGGVGIITMAFVLSNRMVAFIARSDTEKELMNQQVIETSKLASVGELASGVAHEINNPVAIMIEEAGWIQDLLEEEEFAASENLEEFQRALRQINTQGRRCKEITHKLLSFARKTECTLQEIEVNAMIDEMIDLTKQRAKYSNIEIVNNSKGGLPLVCASGTEMQQIFLNLINNAVDAMEQTGGVVTISTRHSQNELLIEISDTGPGIPQSNIDRIFDPFFTTKSVGKGTGLGLSICYGIIKKMGGRIEVVSEIGKGTVFLVCLPIHQTERAGRKSKVAV